MARFDNTIDRDPIAVGNPSDFTLTLGSAGLEVVSDFTPRITNRNLTTTTASTGASLFQWTPPGVSTNGEMLVLFKAASIISTAPASAFIIRGSTFATSGYAFRFVADGSSGGGTTQIIAVSTAGALVATSSIPFTWLANNWYWTRLRASSSTITAKIWDLTSSEPAAVSGTLLSTDVSSGNFSLRTQSTATLLKFSYAWVSAATVTDIAPGPGYAGAMTTDHIFDGIVTLESMQGY